MARTRVLKRLPRAAPGEAAAPAAVAAQAQPQPAVAAAADANPCRRRQRPRQHRGARRTRVEAPRPAAATPERGSFRRAARQLRQPGQRRPARPGHDRQRVSPPSWPRSRAAGASCTGSVSAPRATGPRQRRWRRSCGGSGSRAASCRFREFGRLLGCFRPDASSTMPRPLRGRRGLINNQTIE